MNALKSLSTLKGGWLACRPGSNFMPYCYLQTPSGDVDGEQMESLWRAGLLSAEPYSGSLRASLGGGDYGPYGHIPEFELNFDWTVSPAGRAALSQGEET
ncbi:hypothetical protein MKK88_33580 [Methylobacterium sp. E-005]|uniref:hypothetical protein n=1 Tax=Methylobacterium sp. E-005 TaxID=2836549 RepID=UPI001FBBE9CD|nr:hypothetical protein [Methylobacterium sp. E-005]MCJ2090878.1 hypothetical protein [Methylobacterium sp. E-005]